MTHEVVLQGYNVKPGSLQLGTFDSYGIEKIHVTEDDEWAGLDILAVFHAPDGTATKVVVGANGMLAVPPEATAKQAGGGRIVFAGLAENVQRITVDMRYSTKPHSDIEGDNPGTPTPDVVQQILENSNHAVSIATAAKDAAENARQAAEDAAKKAGEGAGGAAASAAAAKKSAEDAAASSESAAGKAEESASSASAAAKNAKAAQTAQGSAENAAQTAADAAGAARQAAGVAGSAAKASSTSAGEAAQSAKAAETAKQRAEDAAKKALEAKTGSENALQDAEAAKDAASGYADAAAEKATAAAKSENSAADSAAAAKKSADDADNTANSIKDSMAQISENKEAVSKLKEDIVDYLHIDSDNIFDPSKVTKNKYVNSKGEELDTSSYELSEYIPVPFVGDNYLYFNKDAVSSEYSDYKGVHQIILYDSNKIFIKRVACIGALYLAFNQANAKYMRLMIGSNTKDLMVVVSNKYDATFSPTYIPYGGVYSKNFKNEVNDIIDKRQENDTERPLEHIIRDGGLTRIFRTAGVVGDSLSSGCMEYKGSSGNALGYDRYEFSWIQQMRGICGFDKAEIFSVGGLTSKTFWTTQSQKVKNLREDGENHKCQLYFIALGVNDIADTTMEVGTPDDISNESSTTFYGYYSRIIKLIQSQQPKARIFLVGLPNHNKMTIWGKRFTDFKNAIADMPNHFNFVYYLNLYEYEKPYDSEFQKIYFNGFHENALGYARTAWVISSYVDWYIRHNYEEFREVGFIGTDYHYYD